MKFHINKINYIYLLRRSISVLLIGVFLISQICPITHAQSVLNLPVPGAMIISSPVYAPVLMKGVTLDLSNPFLFDFIVHPGDTGLQDEQLRTESTKLIKYFMAALTTPEDEMWVNLSPYEKNRIIPKGFGETEMGRDLLAQDYMLKQLTASLMYPEKELGNEFWERVYEKAQEKYGTTDIPMNTFNKVWIVPERAEIYENGTTAVITEMRLKVLLEEDYLALESNVGTIKHGLGDVSEEDLKSVSGVSSEVIREIIIPEIEKEVNKGKTFANLRQISYSVILATWYKNKVQGSVLEKIYINQGKTKGIDVEDKEINQKIYNQYVEAFKKGVYDFIKEDYDEATQQVIPRKYFSGGAEQGWSDESEARRDVEARNRADKALQGGAANIYVSFEGDAAMLAEARKILKNTNYRPAPLLTRKLLPNEIDQVAGELSYPVHDIERFTMLHGLSLPLVENKIAELLSRHEKDKPTYIVLGRDGEMIFDALTSLAEDTELASRVRMVNIGRSLSERIKAAQPGEDIRERAIKYLAQNNLTSESLKGDRKFVFIDAQYVGSIFDSILEILGTDREQMAERITGYLVMRADEESPYDQLGWFAQPTGESYFELFFNEFGQEWGKGGIGAGMIYGYSNLPTYSTQKKMNWALGNYLQIQPKFARSGFDIEYIDGEWRVLVAEGDRGYPISEFKDWEPTDVTQPITHPNGDPVDPVAATKLQIMTVNYFSNPDRKKRLLGDIPSDEITENMRQVERESSQKLLDRGIDIKKQKREAAEETPKSGKEIKASVIYKFMQIMDWIPRKQPTTLLSYGEAKKFVELDDYLKRFVEDSIDNVASQVNWIRPLERIAGGTPLTLTELLHRDLSAIEIWKALGMEEPFLKKFPNPDDFWKSEQSLFEIYQELDSAMLTDVGGIDLNPNNIDLRLEGSGKKIQFSVGSFNFSPRQIDGLIPVIINIAPITNIPLLLGESTDIPSEELTVTRLD